ncbi:MAG TPA: 5-formyltetrahydrofolate cyclo-ligase [Candidatus Binatia bacterium]|nr:5-formyltetrahydrofolate cyclo-ligase [Candidatus Binatia bacterium]
MPTKIDLRRELRLARSRIPPAQRRRAAQRAATHLARACRRWGARRVAVYLSFGAELDTAPLVAALRQAGCALFVPRIVTGGAMRFVALGRLLRSNRFGIAEPPGGARAARLDAIVLPLVAFDDSGRRLGMGGGYYDRLLSGTRPGRPRRVGYAYALQRVDAVPSEPHDARLDAVVTEQGVRRFR